MNKIFSNGAASPQSVSIYSGGEITFKCAARKSYGTNEGHTVTLMGYESIYIAPDQPRTFNPNYSWYVNNGGTCNQELCSIPFQIEGGQRGRVLVYK